MTRERRREIFNRVVNRWSTQGSAFEAHPVFLAKVEDWIEGRISIQELREFYGYFVRSGPLKSGGDQENEI